VGAHIEMMAEWPARYADTYPIGLQMTGFCGAQQHRPDRDPAHSPRKFRVGFDRALSIRASPESPLGVGPRRKSAPRAEPTPGLPPLRLTLDITFQNIYYYEKSPKVKFIFCLSVDAISCAA